MEGDAQHEITARTAHPSRYSGFSTVTGSKGEIVRPIGPGDGPVMVGAPETPRRLDLYCGRSRKFTDALGRL